MLLGMRVKLLALGRRAKLPELEMRASEGLPLPNSVDAVRRMPAEAPP